MSAFIVAVMGAILQAQVGTQRGASSTVVVAAVIGVDHIAHAFSFIFAAAVGFLVIGIIALIVMEERPLGGAVGAT